MTDQLNLQDAISALDEYGYDKKHSSDLTQARTYKQMEKYLSSLDYSLRRLLILQQVVADLVTQEQDNQARQENIQTFKSKIINLSREYGLSFEQVIDVMQQLESQKK